MTANSDFDAKFRKLSDALRCDGRDVAADLALQFADLSRQLNVQLDILEAVNLSHYFTDESRMFKLAEEMGKLQQLKAEYNTVRAELSQALSPQLHYLLFHSLNQSSP